MHLTGRDGDRRIILSSLFVAAIAGLTVLASQQASPLPNKAGSLKFAAIGDNGTGDRAQYEVGAADGDGARARFPSISSSCSATTCTAGQKPADFVKKFEKPYAPLLEAGVKFQASLGNHDRPENVSYKLYNMDGQRYYTLRPEQRPVLRPRQHADGSETVAVAGGDPAGREGGVEDLLLPPSAVFERGAARLVGRPARRCWSRSSSSTASTSSSPATITSTSASSRRRASTTSCRARRASCERATCGPTTRPPRTSIRIRASCWSRSPDDDMFFQAISRTGQDRRFRRHPSQAEAA